VSSVSLVCSRLSRRPPMLTCGHLVNQSSRTCNVIYETVLCDLRASLMESDADTTTSPSLSPLVPERPTHAPFPAHPASPLLPKETLRHHPHARIRTHQTHQAQVLTRGVRRALSPHAECIRQSA